MDLKNLKDLTALTESKKTPQVEVLEESVQGDLNGILSIVDDALGDLTDKLGKGGSLATLFKSSGASKLDKEKDAEGKNILQQIIAKTTAYKKEIQKLMLEAELIVSQVNEDEELDGDVLLEANTAGYDDSAEFTEEFYTIANQVNAMKAKMKAPRWMKWLKDTDTNFGTDAETPGRAAISAVNNLATQVAEIEQQLDEADNG